MSVRAPKVLADGRVVTFWPLADASVQADSSRIMRLLSRLHRVTVPAQLRRWGPELYDVQVADRFRRAADAGAPADVVAVLSRR